MDASPGRTIHRREHPIRARRLAMTVLGLVMALTTTAAVAQSASASTPAGQRPVVKVQRLPGTLGIVLVDGHGHTLYLDTHDHQGRVSCTGSCARQWPPLLLPEGVAKPVAGAGVTALGTVRRSDHRLQVTSHKLPLYRYVGDRRPGQVRGEGKGGIFFAVSPSGKPRSKPAPTPPPAVAPVSPQPSSAGTSPPPPTVPAAPRATAPPATSPPATSPPATSPPPTSPPATSPPATSPPPTTMAPPGGGVAY